MRWFSNLLIPPYQYRFSLAGLSVPATNVLVRRLQQDGAQIRVSRDALVEFDLERPDLVGGIARIKVAIRDQRSSVTVLVKFTGRRYAAAYIEGSVCVLIATAAILNADYDRLWFLPLVVAGAYIDYVGILPARVSKVRSYISKLLAAKETRP